MQTMLRSDFGAFMEKNLSAHFESAMKKMKPAQYRRVFTRKKSTKAEEHILQTHGFGYAPQLFENGQVTMATTSQGYTYTHEHKQFGLGYSVSRLMIRDNQYGSLTPGWTRAVAKSMRNTKEREAANVFNFGYSTDAEHTLPDGKPLFATDHDTPDGPQSNIIETPAELSETTIEQMKLHVELWENDDGLDADLMWTQLVFHPTLRYDLTRILKSDLRSGMAENDINAMKYSDMELKLAPMRKLANPARFYLQTNEENGAIWWQRDRYETKVYPDVLTDARQFKATERYNFNVASWRGFVSNGAV